MVCHGMPWYAIVSCGQPQAELHHFCPHFAEARPDPGQLQRMEQRIQQRIKHIYRYVYIYTCVLYIYIYRNINNYNRNRIL